MGRWSQIAIIALMGCAACSNSEARLKPLNATAPSVYRLGPGDELRIAVLGLDPLTNTYIVGDSGKISLPMVNEVEVADRTVDEVRAAVANALSARQIVNAPDVSVQVTKYRPFFILGEVQRPGQYPYVPGMTVLTAVSIAGGYTFRANKKHVTITRPARGVADKGRAGRDSPVLPGDTVNVDESWF